MGNIPPYKYHVSIANEKEIKQKDWFFDWQEEFEAERTIFKLTDIENEIVGLISMEHLFDHVFVHAIERQEKFKGQKITPYLFAIASLWSNHLGYDSGFSFEAKT